MILNIKVFEDGNQFCALLLDGSGQENIQDCPCGFGDNPYDAIHALAVDLYDKEYFRADNE